jgi:hypothetical protein
VINPRRDIAAQDCGFGIDAESQVENKASGLITLHIASQFISASSSRFS